MCRRFDQLAKAREGKPFRIAHLSDLHFGSSFDRALWDFVCVTVKNEKPDLILITGDLVDHAGLFMLVLARRQLEELAVEAKHGFRVVPGNHDVGLWGNLRLWPWRSHFRIVFGAGTHLDVQGFPTFTEYRRLPWYKRASLRVGKTLSLMIKRCRFLLPDPGRAALPLVRDDDPKELLLAYFDSNEQSWLASGNVPVDQIYSLSSRVLEFQQGKPEGMLVPRIALVHHHALPIPYSNVREGLTSFEPFLVLRNAGTLLRELCRNDFDIVLHGHKHYASFSRLGYTSENAVESELAVISAGSASITYGEAGRNTLNIIDLYRNGQILFAPLFFGGGQSIRPGQGVSAHTAATAVHPLPMHKRRAFRRALQHQQLLCKSLERITVINASGSSRVHHKAVGFRTIETKRVRERPLSFWVSLGRIDPRSVRLDEDSSRQGFALAKKTEVPSRQIDCLVDLGREISSASEEMSFGVCYRAMNNFALTAWEGDELGHRAHEDWTGVVVHYPCQRLRLEVTLPENLLEPLPRLEVMRPSSYPIMEFDRFGEVKVAFDDQWDLDTEMNALECSGFGMIGERTASLTVEFPLVGYQYRIKWNIHSSEEEGVSTVRRGDAVALRQALLRLADAGSPSPAAELAEKVQRHLHNLLVNIQQKFRGRFGESEELSANIFAYDASAKGLRLVAEAGSSQAFRGHCRDIPLGEGVAGAAFKKRRLQLFVSPELRADAADGAYIYWDAAADKEGLLDYTVLVACPLALPDSPNREGLSPQETVGVFRVGSSAPDSGLLRLVTDSNPGQSEKIQTQALEDLWIRVDVFWRSVLDHVNDGAGLVI